MYFIRIRLNFYTSTSLTPPNYFQARAMRRALDVRKQLLGIMDRYRLETTSAGRDYNRIRMAICSGYFAHAAKKDAQDGCVKLLLFVLFVDLVRSSSP